jgi:hypothetical protein
MRAKSLSLVWIAALASLAGACGKGEAVFNIDVYSFIKGTGKDVVPYAVLPGPTPLDTSSAPQLIRLLGAGSSIVDSVLISGTDSVVNQSGSGTLAFKVYLAGDSAGTRQASALALSVAATAVSGTTPRPLDPISCPPIRPTSCLLLSSANPLFTKDSVWARVAVTVSNTGATPFAGQVVLKSLMLSVFINDKIF